MAAITTKICTSLLSRLRLLGETPLAKSRNFNMLVRPIPNQAIQTSSPMLNPAAVIPVIPIIGLQKLLAPFQALITQVAGFKVKGRLKRRCKDCYFVIRQQRHYVICPTHPRHKQMSIKKRDYKTWILTHATQSKVRPY